MTLIGAVPLTKVRTCNRPVRHSDESQNLRFLTITPIPDQVRNDGTAVVIPELNSGQALTNPPGGNHPRSCHPDESQDHVLPEV